MKKILSLLISVFLIAGLYSCGGGGGEDPASGGDVSLESGGYARGVPVSEPDSGYVARFNDIEIRAYSVSLDGGASQSGYIQISGLKDREVQKKINDEIRDTFDYFADDSYTPPYEIFSSRLEGLKNSKLHSKGVTTTVRADYAGILSLTMYSWLNYEGYSDSDEIQYVYAEDMHTLNFDLNSGKRIALSDLLVDGRGLEYFNEKVKEEFLGSPTEYGESLSDVLTDFKTLSDDSKYCIDYATGDVVLVFDYETPGFDKERTYPALMTLDISEVSALRTRFNKGDALFESPSENYMILSNHIPETTNDYDYFDPYFEDVPLSCSVQRVTSPNAPLAVQEAAYISEGEIVSFMEDLRFQYNQYSMNSPVYVSITGSGVIGANMYRIGDYTTVERYTVANLYNSYNYETLYGVNNTVRFVYKGTSGRPMRLEDVFREGVDYVEILKEAFKKNIDFHEAYELETDPELLDAFLDEKIYNISGFGIENESLYFGYDGGDSIAAKYFSDQNIWSADAICSFANYSNLGGPTNLNIFD